MRAKSSTSPLGVLLDVGAGVARIVAADIAAIRARRAALDAKARDGTE